MAEAGQEPGQANTVNDNLYRQILGLKEVHFLSIFSLIYVGVEVSLGGEFFLRFPGSTSLYVIY